ncbi:MAG: phospho-N-acetylmuramoyl-pentapeptide-transferase [Lachnospiraceae bacterium]|nr:phospho-N-acetylmuramoyl-pentapeptide-transferase [Lachnospiraceae bacterium]
MDLLFIYPLAAFLATFILIAKYKDKLPSDQGRQYAVDGTLSAGKPRGTGIIFVSVFVLASMAYVGIRPDIYIYLILIFIEMLTGFFDDKAEKPWSEYKKAILDLLVSAGIAVTYIFFNGTGVNLYLFDVSFELPKVVFGILATVLVWASINVTNCTDGVDGLSGSLTIVTLLSFAVMMGREETFNGVIYIFVAVLLPYLWHNANPSKLMMGDAGSRAMGTLIAVTALVSKDPFMFLIFAAVIMFDGGLGLVKVALLRFLKIKILKNTRTPLHDHTRKERGWSATQTVFRFVVIQIAISGLILLIKA